MATRRLKARRGNPRANEAGGVARRRIFAITAAIAVVGGLAIAAAVVAVLSSRGSSDKASPPARPAVTSYFAFVHLFAKAIPGRSTNAILKQWPVPYQEYRDQYQHSCYEWYEKPPRPNATGAMFNLCFGSKGVLANKELT